MSAPLLFPDVEGNASRLQAWLQDRLEGFGGVMEIDRLHGGRSNPGWRLRTAQRDCVLRARPGPRANLLPSAHAIEREFRVQQALAGSAVPVAAMHALCEDESLIGAGFYMFDKICSLIIYLDILNISFFKFLEYTFNSGAVIRVSSILVNNNAAIINTH